MLLLLFLFVAHRLHTGPHLPHTPFPTLLSTPFPTPTTPQLTLHGRIPEKEREGGHRRHEEEMVCSEGKRIVLLQESGRYQPLWMHWLVCEWCKQQPVCSFLSLPPFLSPLLWLVFVTQITFNSYIPCLILCNWCKQQLFFSLSPPFFPPLSLFPPFPGSFSYHNSPITHPHSFWMMTCVNHAKKTGTMFFLCLSSPWSPPLSLLLVFVSQITYINDVYLCKSYTNPSLLFSSLSLPVSLHSLIIN